MIYNFSISPKAIKEIQESGDWYEEKQIGLGYRFETQVAAKIESVRSNPFHYPLKGKYREANLPDFPFLILYEIDEVYKAITIASVFHTSRHPNKK
ncbi:type II toxin-antitoxin system RelE/ParE family toxin [Mucilaginibacter pedocola]|uniref:Addiction module toxin RelE n=1 Tax=Mucilaginibacter pedocola TaxID=1792845 RepID=A0A1S9PDW3_9SPHI|nr:type II toxin-antitoxin system RelE/ParE family toxin [Mucilaginibacter pedocola]OOQ59133.1 hypothetical protein BC343_29360 [Mucilaginibacter pedocola]